MGTEPVFIAGMYKSGTSWLLRMLNRHPAFRGIPEIDPIAAAVGRVTEGGSLLPPRERLASYFAQNAWGSLPKDVSGDPEASAIIQGATGTTAVGDLFTLAPAQAVGAILAYYDLRQRRRTEVRELLSLPDLTRADLEALYTAVRDARGVYEAADAFVNIVSHCLHEGETLVIKGADLIARYAELSRWRPKARKIIVVRDGRDAALSALHFRRLMRSVNSRHVDAVDDYWEVLGGWASRVRMLQAVAGDPCLAILRYEDLQADFLGTARAMFRWLSAASDTPLLKEIQAGSSFEAVTGRKPGEVAAHVIRRGISGEWHEALSSAEQQRAWQEAGDLLAMLGYTPSGALEPLGLPGALGPRAVPVG